MLQAHLINQAIANHLETGKAHVIGLRVAPVFLLRSEFQSWPLVEWTEDHRDVLALFHFDHKDSKYRTYSWIMHSGTRTVGGKQGISWFNASVSWDVGNLGHLKLLFGVTQHLLDILEWPIAESVLLYAHCPSKDPSKDRFVQ
jgi:hypothetical protein